MNRLRWVLGAVVVAVVAVVAVTWGYIHFVNGDQPAKLALDASGTAATTGPAAPTGPIEGSWRLGAGSEAGYRVKEVLFGQSAEAVGRTDQVTGTFQIGGTRVTAGAFTVDLASVHSNEDRRDGQFRGRIMDVAQYPTAGFELTSPIDLPGDGADGRAMSVTASGRLTIKDVTRAVAVPLQVQRSGATIRVVGSLDVRFADWHIDNPSGGPARTDDHGLIEFLLVFTR